MVSDRDREPARGGGHGHVPVATASRAGIGVLARARGDRIATRPGGRARALGAPGSYWRASRSHRYSLVFALPLLVFYEVLAAALSYTSGGVRNGAARRIKPAFIRAEQRRVGAWGRIAGEANA